MSAYILVDGRFGERKQTAAAIQSEVQRFHEVLSVKPETDPERKPRISFYLGSKGGIMDMTRGSFIRGGLMAASVPGVSFSALPCKSITIAETDCAFEREPMVRPFGFKGGHRRA